MAGLSRRAVSVSATAILLPEASALMDLDVLAL